MKLFYLITTFLFLSFGLSNSPSTNKQLKNENIIVCDFVQAPFSHSFDGFPLNECWTTIISNNDISIYPLEAINSTPTPLLLPASGSHFLYFDNDDTSIIQDDIYLISPEISDLDSNKRLKFKLISTVRFAANSYNSSTIKVGTMTDPLDINTFTLFKSISPDQMSELISDDEYGGYLWKEHTVYLNDYINEGDHIAIVHGDEGHRSDFFIDDFVYEEIPACPEPYYPDMLEVNDYDVTLTWETFEESNPTGWQVEFGFPGFLPGTGTIVNTAINTIEINGLVDNTTYEFYVRAICGASFSELSTKQIFTTKCSGVSVGYQENFDNQDEGLLKSCWTYIKPEINNTYWDEINYISVVNNVSPNFFPAYSSPNSIYFLNEVNHPLNDGMSDQLVLVSPRLIGLNNYKKISFQMRADPSQYATPSSVRIGTLTDPEDPDTFTEFHEITDLTQNEGDWKPYEIELSNYYLNDEYIAIKQSHINERQVIQIDNFEYSEIGCVTPTELYASQTAENTITVGWNDNNNIFSTWEVEYGLSGFVQGTGTIVVASSNPFEVDGLIVNEVYDFYVRSVCDGVLVSSTWSDLYTAKVSCTETVPYFENFDQYNASQNYDINGIDGFCWTRNNPNKGGLVDATIFYVPSKSAPNAGFVNYYNSSQSPSTGIMISPFLPELDNNKLLKLWSRNDDDIISGPRAGFVIGTIKNPVDIETFTPFITFNAEDFPAYGKEFLIDFSSYTGTDKHIAIKHNEENEYSFLQFDDFQLLDNQTCIAPYDLSVAYVYTNQARIDWDLYGSIDIFEIEYGEEGFLIGNGITLTTTNSFYILNGLDQNTVYDVYIKNSCSSGQESDWSMPLKVSTSCGTTNFPWVEDFEGMVDYGPNILPECFKVEGEWVSSNQYISPFQKGDNDNSYIYSNPIPQTGKSSIITPMIDLQAGTTYNFSFKVLKDDFDYTGQGFYVHAGRGQNHNSMSSFINYFSDFQYGSGQYYTISTTFTPISNGGHSFAIYFRSSDNIILSVDSFSLDFEDFPEINVQGDVVNYNFENGQQDTLIFEDTENTKCRISTDPNTSNKVLLMGGNDSEQGWVATQNSSDIWINNENSITKLNFKFDATNYDDLFLDFDMKQIFQSSPDESRFRIMVNGNVINTDYLPSTATNDPFTTISLDLTPYIGSIVNISMQHIGKNKNTFFYTGDSCFIDNINIYRASVPIAATSVAVNPSEVTLNVNENAQLTATVFPQNVTNDQVTWSSINSAIATVDSDGLVTAISQGITSIVCTTVDGGFTDFSTININEILDSTDNDKYNITITPNPTKNKVIINLIDSSLLQSVKVFDVQGKLILKSKNTFVNLSEFQSGVYFLKCLLDNKISVHKIIKID